MMFLQKQTRKNERGNVLFLIMIGIVFIGLLTMVLTRNSSSVDQSGDREQIQVKIGQVLRYAKSIEAAMQEMRLRGISENDFSFENATTATDYTNANCTTTDCRLFDVGGAGLVYRNVAQGINDGSEWIFTGENNVGTTADPVGTTAARSGNDLIMLLPNANAQFCIELNRNLGVGDGTNIPLDTGGVDTGEFTGAFANSLNIIDGDPTPFELDGQTAGCFMDGADSNRVYMYYVLLPR